MNEISPEQLLSQMRSLGKSLQVPPAVNAPAAGEFGQLLKTSLDAVNSTQMQAGALKAGFENRTSDVSLAEVMIAGQKADISFRAVTEVRNKLVQAYQDIMNMPV